VRLAGLIVDDGGERVGHRREVVRVEPHAHRILAGAS
jgi:hypothetical protein